MKKAELLPESLAVALGALGFLAASCLVQPPSAVPSTSAPSEAPPPEPEPIGGNLLKASDFQDGKSVPWMTSFSAPASGSAATIKCRLATDPEGEAELEDAADAAP